MLGNEDLTPEEIQSYELGYQSILTDKMKVKIDLFINQCRDFIVTTSWAPVDMYTANEMALQLTGSTIEQLLASGVHWLIHYKQKMGKFLKRCKKGWKIVARCLALAVR